MGSGQITKNQINLDLIKIFQFCLKIQHLWRLPHPFCLKIQHLWRFSRPWVGVCMGGLVDGWGQVKSLKIK